MKDIVLIFIGLSWQEGVTGQ